MKHIEWIWGNIQWIFSGVGIAIFSWIIHLIKNKRKPKKETENHIEYFDDSKFISENPPDGISVLAGSTLEKSWTIQNNGNMIWSNRYLKCVNEVPNFFYPEKKIVKIPKLKPREKFTLKVKYHAEIEGEYFSQWKMFDENDRMIFPQIRGLSIYIRVVTNEGEATK